MSSASKRKGSGSEGKVQHYIKQLMRTTYRRHRIGKRWRRIQK